MDEVVFITGNQNKAEYLARLLDYPIAHRKVELDEIQSLDLHEVVRHKLVQAYEKVKKPVLVDDVALEFTALGTLPGTFIKWFLEELSLDQLCRLVDGQTREVIARCVMGYYDGNDMVFFEGSHKGTVPETPRGTSGFGWDPIYIPVTSQTAIALPALRWI